jgi:hypothetical protein
MTRSILLTTLLVLLGVTTAQAFELRHCRCNGNTGPWHTEYYSPAEGAPKALVVPPTARTHTVLNWDASHVKRIRAQYGAGYIDPGPYDPRGFQPTPRWPASTEQLGTNYVRGPW